MSSDSLLDTVELDQHGALRGRALVVHRGGAALVGIGAVVDHGDQIARDLLPDPAGVHRETFQVEIRLETVADRFVDEGSAGLAGKHDRVRAGRRRLGANVQDRAASRVARGLLDRFVGEHLEASGPADRLEPRFEDVSLLGHRLHSEVQPHPGVGPEKPVAIGYEDLLHALAVARGHLVDPRVEGSRDPVRAAE